MDNRPLNFEEFESHLNQVVFVSATPGPHEMGISAQIVEQVIRPTGLLDPVIEVKPTRGQIDDLLDQVQQRVEAGQRTLVTTLTKRMAEDLADYLQEMGVRTHYLHSEVDTMERVEILRDLRLGVYDVVVGINLLREGLDLPEVSLVCILDADKEGYLRSGGSLVQTIGRAARHVEGRVIMYADNMTDSMKFALSETERRRAIQRSYNEEHGISPEGITKAIRDITDQIKKVADERVDYDVKKLPKDEMARLVRDLEAQMKTAAKSLEFEKAALLRDQVVELRKAMIDDQSALHEFAQSSYGSLGSQPRPRPGAATSGGRRCAGDKNRGRCGREREGASALERAVAGDVVAEARARHGHDDGAAPGAAEVAARREGARHRMRRRAAGDRVGESGGAGGERRGIRPFGAADSTGGAARGGKRRAQRELRGRRRADGQLRRRAVRRGAEPVRRDVLLGSGGRVYEHPRAREGRRADGVRVLAAGGAEHVVPGTRAREVLAASRAERERRTAAGAVRLRRCGVRADDPAERRLRAAGARAGDVRV